MLVKLKLQTQYCQALPPLIFPSCYEKIVICGIKRDDLFLSTGLKRIFHKIDRNSRGMKLHCNKICSFSRKSSQDRENRSKSYTYTCQILCHYVYFSHSKTLAHEKKQLFLVKLPLIRDIRFCKEAKMVIVFENG